MKTKRLWAVLLLLLSLLFLLPGCGELSAKKQAELNALLASKTNMDGSGEIYIRMPYDDLIAKLDELGVPYTANIKNNLVAGSGPYGYSFSGMEFYLGTTPADGVVEIQLVETKEGLKKGDSVEKLRELYPDRLYEQNLNKEEGNALYFLPGVRVREGWFIERFWQGNDTYMVVSAIEVTGPEPSDTVGDIIIKYIPERAALERPWK